MTVEQLIKQLQDLPGEMEVWMADELGEPTWQLVHDEVHVLDGKLIIETY